MVGYNIFKGLLDKPTKLAVAPSASLGSIDVILSPPISWNEEDLVAIRVVTKGQN